MKQDNDTALKLKKVLNFAFKLRPKTANPYKAHTYLQHYDSIIYRFLLEPRLNNRIFFSKTFWSNFTTMTFTEALFGIAEYTPTNEFKIFGARHTRTHNVISEVRYHLRDKAFVILPKNVLSCIHDLYVKFNENALNIINELSQQSLQDQYTFFRSMGFYDYLEYPNRLEDIKRKIEYNISTRAANFQKSIERIHSNKKIFKDKKTFSVFRALVEKQMNTMPNSTAKMSIKSNLNAQKIRHF